MRCSKRQRRGGQCTQGEHLQRDADVLEEGVGTQAQALEPVEGLRGAYLLLDRPGGRGSTVTLWESEEALDESAQAANELRRAATEPSGASVESVDSYEVALTVGLWVTRTPPARHEGTDEKRCGEQALETAAKRGSGHLKSPRNRQEGARDGR